MAVQRLNVKHFALTIGLFAVFLHLVWIVIVAMGGGASVTAWLESLHFVSSEYTVASFNAVTAIILLIVAFVFWAVFGAIFAYIWNWVARQKWVR